MNIEIEKLTQLGTDAVQAAIGQYAEWYVISSLCWLALGAVCAIFAVTAWRKREDDDDWAKIALILVIVTVLTVVCNVPTLLQPRAYAIHQLIKDAR